MKLGLTELRRIVRDVVAEAKKRESDGPSEGDYLLVPIENEAGFDEVEEYEIAMVTDDRDELDEYPYDADEYGELPDGTLFVQDETGACYTLLPDRVEVEDGVWTKKEWAKKIADIEAENQEANSKLSPKDKKILKMLAMAFTHSSINAKDVRAIRITSVTKNGIGVADAGHVLGHISAFLELDELQRAGTTPKELAQWIIDHGGAKQKRTKRKPRGFSYYD